MILALLGDAAGLAICIPAFRLLSGQLAGIGGLSPWTLVTVAMREARRRGRRALRQD